MAVLVTIAKKWKQPRYSSAGEWVKKNVPYLYLEYYLVIKRKRSSDTCYEMVETQNYSL